MLTNQLKFPFHLFAHSLVLCILKLPLFKLRYKIDLFYGHASHGLDVSLSNFKFALQVLFEQIWPRHSHRPWDRLEWDVVT